MYCLLLEVTFRTVLNLPGFQVREEPRAEFSLGICPLQTLLHSGQ